MPRDPKRRGRESVNERENTTEEREGQERGETDRSEPCVDNTNGVRANPKEAEEPGRRESERERERRNPILCE